MTDFVPAPDRTLSNAAYIAWLAHTLETAPMHASGCFQPPDGVRVLQMPDTLARKIAARLRSIGNAL